MLNIHLSDVGPHAISLGMSGAVQHMNVAGLFRLLDRRYSAERYAEPHMWKLARTLTGYHVGVLVVLAILNVIAWLADAPHRMLGVFPAGFLMGALGMYIAAYLYGYRKVT